MDLTFVLSAIIFTLLAIVVATSVFNGSSSAADFANARSYFGAAGGLDQSGPRQNGHLPEKKKKKTADDWCEMSGSSHDHWDVVKSVQSEEAHPQPHTEELATPVEHPSSPSSLSIPRPGSRHMSLEVDSSSKASPGRGHRRSHREPGINDKVESNANNSLKYVPGKARSHHLQMMMSKDELEEEQSSGLIYTLSSSGHEATDTCAESLRNSQDKSFRKAFLPNIRLFLHKDNINMSEWNRLSHFNNPFGFMEYKYDDVMSSVKLIPKPKEPLLSPKPGSGGCVRCAVVGNGGILNGSKMGKEIDSHDYVFRVNGALIKGYEEDVGNKTSVYVHTAHSLSASVFWLKKYGFNSAPYYQGVKHVLIPEGPRTYYAGQYNESRFYVLHQDFLRYVRNRFLLSPNLNASFWPIVRPTNGAFTLFLALHTCDTVSAYGFMTEGYKKYSNYYFERKVKTNVIFVDNHDYILELKTWKQLHNTKVSTLKTEGSLPTEGAARLFHSSCCGK
ncbi:hypothetical protein INR49_027293, partial [Caranx melampygus]